MKIFVDLEIFCLVLVIVAKSDQIKKDDLEPVIGIDLGTTGSCVGVFRNGKVEIIPNEQGNRITPSYVAFTSDGVRLIGDTAKNQQTMNPENTIYDVKRLIGRKWNDTAVQNAIKSFPFTVIEKHSKPYISVQIGQSEKIFAPEEISAMILGKMKEIAETYLGKKVTQAVITVPASFKDAQRQATKDAGIIAGLNVIRIINEPTAAAFAHAFEKNDKEKNVLVFDLGGGTFDVSVLTLDNGVFQVIATGGDNELGGEDFEQRVIDYFINLYKKRKGKDIRGSHRAVQKLRREVEKAKKALSSRDDVKIEIESFYRGEDYSAILTRRKFEELNMDLFQSTLEIIKNVLNEAHMTQKDIDNVVLVGGSTYIPKIQELIGEFFGREKLSLGIDPIDAIAIGATVQAAILSRETNTNSILLSDVNSFTIGIETVNNGMRKLFPKYTPIPGENSEVFTTASDNQDNVAIRVFEGESSNTANNHLLGEFALTGILPAPKGTPQIIVTFKIDANGILQVTAKDVHTGNFEQIIINNAHNRLTHEEINQMIWKADRFADDDKKLKEKVEASNELESYIYSLKTLTNKIVKIDKVIEEKLRWLEQDQDTIKAEEIKRQKKKLEELVQPLMRQLQQKVCDVQKGTYNHDEL